MSLVEQTTAAEAVALRADPCDRARPLVGGSRRLPTIRVTAHSFAH